MGVVYVGVVCISRLLKEELAWAVDKWLWVISNILLFKICGCTSKELNSQAILSFNNIVCFAMCH